VVVGVALAALELVGVAIVIEAPGLDAFCREAFVDGAPGRNRELSAKRVMDLSAEPR
jgi:hypothetical protein